MIYVKLDADDYIISACKSEEPAVNPAARGLHEVVNVATAPDATFRKYDRATKTAGEKRPD